MHSKQAQQLRQALTCHETSFYKPAKALVRLPSALIERPELVLRIPLPLVIAGPQLSSARHDTVGWNSATGIDDRDSKSRFFQVLPGVKRRNRDSARGKTCGRVWDLRSVAEPEVEPCTSLSATPAHTTQFARLGH